MPPAGACAELGLACIKLCIILIHRVNRKGRSKPITLRNVSPEIARAIQQRAGDEGISLNKAVGSLLARSVASTSANQKEKLVHDDLDDLSGAWSLNDADEFDRALSVQRAIDPRLWE